MSYGLHDGLQDELTKIRNIMVLATVQVTNSRRASSETAPVFGPPKPAVGDNSMTTNAAESQGSDGVECPTCGDEFNTRQGLGQHHSNQQRISIREYEKQKIEDPAKCPTCGDLFKTEGAMKKHHYHSHGESIVEYQKVECDNCGDVVKKHPTDVARYDVHYCSKECWAEGRNKREWVVCDYCGEQAKKRADVIGRYDRHFCSRECLLERISEEYDWPTGEDHWTYNSVEITCEREGCGNTRKVIQSRKNNARFCSVECRNRHMVAENHPDWKEDRDGVAYPQGWHKTRQEVLERDEYRCQDPRCGMTESEHVEKYGRSLDVHHIDGDIENNSADNLITLCKKCHIGKWQKLSPLRPQTTSR